MVEGFYSIAFTGATGSGFGILMLVKGIVVGADAAGATYDGTYRPGKDSSVEILVVMKAPAGVRLVQTGMPLQHAVELPIAAQASTNNERPQLIQTPLGPVNVAVKKIRDLPGSIA